MRACAARDALSDMSDRGNCGTRSRRLQTAQKKTEVSELEMNKIFDERTTKPRAGVTISAKKGTNSAPVATPKAHFVNTEKIKKRPLSKNAYPKKEIPVPKEERPSAPVKIIDKPAKDSKAGLIVTIIITIILGAAAGTVAFLLLPK